MGASGKITSASEANADGARPSGIPRTRGVSAGAALVGAVIGATFGTFGGPIGMVIGVLLGAVGGATVSDALHRMQDHRSSHQAQLDKDIGVIGGDLGAAPWDQPPDL